MDRKTGKPKDVNGTALLLKGAGVAAKPQDTAQYDAAVKLLRGKVVPVTIDWRGKNKDTGEVVETFANFPMDPDRPGQRKSIVKQGDVLDGTQKGQVVTSEVIFANAQIRFVQDPTRK